MPIEALDDFLDAAEQAGHSPTPTTTAISQQGVSVAQVNQRRGFRSSTARGYLAPVRRRRNLTIRTGALSTRVL